MTSQEILFAKYHSREAYHWQQVSRSVRRHNAYVVARYNAVLTAAGDLEGQQVLDLGGGDGALSYLLTQKGAQLVTVDIIVLGLQFALREFEQRGLSARVAACSAYELPFASGTFDQVVCSDVIEHVRRPEWLLQEAARVLKHNGRIVLTTPLRITEQPIDPMHAKEFFAGELQTLFGQIFAEVKIDSFAPMALFELYGLPFRWLKGRPLFRYLFNIASILGYNPFAICTPFRFFSMLIATGQKR